MLRKFSEVTSCNGIFELYESRNHKCRFLFWTLIMTLMFSATVFYTYATIRGYIDTQKVTSIQSVWEKTLEMPEVLICFNGGVNVSAMIEANFSNDLMKAFIVKDISPPETVHQELIKYIKPKNLKIRDVYQEISYSCGQMIENFAIPGRWGINGVNDKKSRCNESVTLLAFKGSCYLFPNNSQQIYPGNGGMEIKLKGMKNEEIFDEDLVHVKNTNDYSISMEKSFGSQNSLRSRVAIPLNYYVTITLNTKRHVRIGNDCDNRPNVHNSNTCYMNCYLDEYVKSCNCQTIDYCSFERYPDVDVCDLFTEFSCHINMNDTLDCQAKCLPKCDEWIFENSVALSKLTERSLVNGPISIVLIQYGTMQYTKLQIEEVKAFTIEMAIANVGGQAGLWLGASFITIIQAVYYFVLAIVDKLESKKQGKENEERQ